MRDVYFLKVKSFTTTMTIDEGVSCPSRDGDIPVSDSDKSCQLFAPVRSLLTTCEPNSHLSIQSLANWSYHLF